MLVRVNLSDLNKMKIREIKAKSVLTKSGLPDTDWVINPYVGCQFGCKYCYATFIGRWKHPGEEWGEFADVKINAPEILKKELERLEKKNKSKNFGSILFSSVTDCYSPPEAKYKITRKCLEILADFDYRGEIGILTKSPLVVRDIDIFKRINVEVGLTVTTLDDKVVRFLEGCAPSASARIGALRKLHDSGIPIYAFVGPVLPYFVSEKEKFEQLFKSLKAAGVNEIYIENINLSLRIRERLFGYLNKEDPKLIPYFEKAETREYQENLEKIIYPLLKKISLEIIGGKILYHTKNWK